MRGEGRGERGEGFPAPRYAWYVVGVLCLAYVFALLDRQVLSLLVGPMRADLGISDTQVSLLQGFSFAVFYTCFGLLLGRLADTGNRRNLIIGGTTLWSAFTAACGLAQRYWQLLVLRMGVGVGEAALSPAAYSLLADYFPAEQRATAFSVYSMGIYVGVGLASVLGGVIVQYSVAGGVAVVPILGAVRPWQLVFLLIGVPGLLIAALMATVREPERRGAGEPIPLRAVVDHVRAHLGTFVCLILGISLISLANYGAAAWMPSVFMRDHGWSVARAGVFQGLVAGGGGAIGIVGGGWLADRMERRGGRDAYLRVAAVAALLLLPCGTLYLVMPTGRLAAVAFVPLGIVAAVPFGVGPAAIQQLVPPAMRGQLIALYLFMINLIGLGVGPTAVALVTDHVFHDDRAVNLSLFGVAAIAYIGAIGLLWRGLPRFAASRDRLAMGGLGDASRSR